MSGSFVDVNVIENLKRDGHPIATYTKGRHVLSLTFLLTRQLAEVGSPNFLIHGRYLRYIYFVRKVLRQCEQYTDTGPTGPGADPAAPGA